VGRPAASGEGGGAREAHQDPTRHLNSNDASFQLFRGWGDLMAYGLDLQKGPGAGGNEPTLRGGEAKLKAEGAVTDLAA
jgi:hypothetical protein